MLASGTIELGMVVASDMDPEPGVSEGFSFPAVGGAVLLSSDDSRAGFTAFQFATFPEHAELFQSYVDWHKEARRGLHHGRNILTVEIAESYASRALECAESTARELAGAQALDLGEVDLLVATASVPGFANGLAATSRRIRRAGRVACGRPLRRAHGRSRAGARHGASRRRRARRCSSPLAPGSRSPSRSTGHDPSVSRQRAESANVARLQGCSRPQRTARPGLHRRTLSSCDRWRESWSRSLGASSAAARRTSSRRLVNTRACSARGCATRRT